MRLHRIAVLTALALAACGGGDPPTRDEFVTRANEICADSNEKIDRMIAEMADDLPGNEDAQKAFYEDYADLNEDMTDELTDLGAPEGDAAAERYLDQLERNVRGYRDALDQDEIATDAFLSRANNSALEARHLAEEAGLEECSPLG